jgi:hypothetical protein
MSVSFTSGWAFGARVHVDNDLSYTAVVTALTFRAGVSYPMVEVSWIRDGQLARATVEAWRLVDDMRPVREPYLPPPPTPLPPAPRGGRGKKHHLTIIQ